MLLDDDPLEAALRRGRRLDVADGAFDGAAEALVDGVEGVLIQADGGQQAVILRVDLV